MIIPPSSIVGSLSWSVVWPLHLLVVENCWCNGMQAHLPLSKTVGPLWSYHFLQKWPWSPNKVSPLLQKGDTSDRLKGHFFSVVQKSGNKPTTTRLLGHIPGKWGMVLQLLRDPCTIHYIFQWYHCISQWHHCRQPLITHWNTPCKPLHYGKGGYCYILLLISQKECQWHLQLNFVHWCHC